MSLLNHNTKLQKKTDVKLWEIRHTIVKQLSFSNQIILFYINRICSNLENKSIFKIEIGFLSILLIVYLELTASCIWDNPKYTISISRKK